MEGNTTYSRVFETLNKLGASQFTGPLSSTQYLLAYQLVSRYATKPVKALDWGTGTGHFSLFLLEQGHDVTAFTIDTGSAFSEYLSNTYQDQYTLVADPESVRKLPFDDDSFDLVTSIGVLEHVRESGGNEVDSLLEIKRVLKRDGVFVCYHFPNKYSWIEGLARHLKDRHSHPYLYTRGDIRQLLHEVGFELLESRRYGIFPRLMFKHVNASPFVMALFNGADRFLSFVLNPFCQNHYFVIKNSD